MKDTNIDNLLNELNESTIKCNNLLVLTESTDNIDGVVSSKLSSLKDNLLKFTLSMSQDQISQEMIDLIHQVNTINITEDHKVYTYPNIHSNKKYDVDASCMMKFITDKLNYNILNDVDYEKSDLLEEAVAYTYKKLTGESVGVKLPIDKFREKYRFYCLGANTRSYLIPNVDRLTKLAIKSPYAIAYVNNQLLNKHINSLNKYSMEITNNFKTVCDKKPELINKLNSYIDCIETAIKYMTKIYRDIISVMKELDVEYKRIFREIISIENSLSHMEESVGFDSFTNEMNIFYKDLVNNSILTETSQESYKNQFKESLIKIINNFVNNSNDKLNNIQTNIESLKGTRGLIINIDQKMCNNHPVHTYSNINCIIDDDIINNISVSEINDNDINYKSILSNILSNINKFKNCYVDPGDKSWILSTMKNIRLEILGSYTIKTIDVESLANNLINIPKIMTIIYNKMMVLNIETYKKLNELKNIIFENCDCNDIKNKIINIVTYYNIYSKLLDCIYDSLDIIIKTTINNINEIINKE